MSVVGQIFSRRRHGREPKKKHREKNFRYKKNSKAEKKEQKELFRVDSSAAGFWLSVSAVWARRIYYYSGREKHLAKILLACPRIWNEQKWNRIRFRGAKQLLFPRWIVLLSMGSSERLVMQRNHTELTMRSRKNSDKNYSLVQMKTQVSSIHEDLIKSKTRSGSPMPTQITKRSSIKKVSQPKIAPTSHENHSCVDLFRYLIVN